MRDFRQVHGSDEIGDIRGGGVVRSIRADANSRGLLEEDPLYRHAHEITLELTFDIGRVPMETISRDIHPIAVAKLSTETRWNEIQAGSRAAASP